MKAEKTPLPNRRRRQLVLSGAALLSLLHGCGGGGGDGAASSSAAPAAQPDAAGIDNTPLALSLAEYGGVPGADPAAIRSAFDQAFDRLKNAGGGTLNVAAGTYDLGSYANDTSAISVVNLRNVQISAYGARLTMTTTAVATPAFLHIWNPSNVTIAGMSFHDYGTDLSVDWRGAVCIQVSCTIPSSGVRTIDCVAENVLTFVKSYGAYELTDMDIQGTVRDSYYALNVNYNGRGSTCRLSCERVKRGFLGFGAQDWNMEMNCIGGRNGSNGFVALVATADAPVADCNVVLTCSGDLSPYSAMVHFDHQDDADIPQHFRDISADVTLDNVAGSPETLFVFDHHSAAGTPPTTARTWENIRLSGRIAGNFTGTIVKNPSISNGAKNAIQVSPALAAFQDLRNLPAYIKIAA